MDSKISAILIIYNEEKVIERCLKSLVGVADEILIAHDGKCKDNTIKICKKYTNKVFIMPHRGRSAFHWIPLIKKAKHDWILKLDADEFLSKDLKKNIKELAKNDKADAYSFIWPWYGDGKYITKRWPRKTSLYRKSKISGMGFPAWDTPIVNGVTIKTDYVLEHKPFLGSDQTWKNFWKKAIKRYCKGQAEYSLVDFKSIEKYNYTPKDFPWSFRLRRRFPLLSAPLFSLAALIKIPLKDNAWREGKPVFIEAVQTSIYYLILGAYIHRLKLRKN